MPRSRYTGFHVLPEAAEIATFLTMEHDSNMCVAKRTFFAESLLCYLFAVLLVFQGAIASIAPVANLSWVDGQLLIECSLLDTNADDDPHNDESSLCPMAMLGQTFAGALPSPHIIFNVDAASGTQAQFQRLQAPTSHTKLGTAIRAPPFRSVKQPASTTTQLQT